MFVAGGGIFGFRSRGMSEFINEAFKSNVIAYACIRKIANAIAELQLEVAITRLNGEIEVVNQHPYLDLIRRPNPTQSQADFFFALIVYRLVTGNAYIIRDPAVPVLRRLPKELWVVPSQAVDVQPSESGTAGAYIVQLNGRRAVFNRDARSGDCAIMHNYEPDPENPYIGLSPLHAAGLSVDLHNHGLTWNKSLLRYGARPMSVFIKKTGFSSDNERTAVMESLRKWNEGSTNAGRSMLMSGDFDLKSNGDTNKDMEFTSVLSTAERNIALALGVPFPLIAPDAATFSNMDAAKLAFHEDTVIPLANSLLASINQWFGLMAGAAGPKAELRINEDAVPALEPRRRIKYERMGTLVEKGIITRNEARIELGFDEVDGGDVLLVPGGSIPLGLAGVDMGADAPVPMVDVTPSQAEERSRLLRSLRATGMSEKEAEAALALEFNVKSASAESKTLADSTHDQFDFGFAVKVAEDYPMIWALGDKLYGRSPDVALDLWQKARDGMPSQEWLAKREQWARKHRNDTSLAGVVAQMKWGVVGASGMQAMKALVEEEMARTSTITQKAAQTAFKAGDSACWDGGAKRGVILNVKASGAATMRVYEKGDAGKWEITLRTADVLLAKLQRVPSLSNE